MLQATLPMSAERPAQIFMKIMFDCLRFAEFLSTWHMRFWKMHLFRLGNTGRADEAFDWAVGLSFLVVRWGIWELLGFSKSRLEFCMTCLRSQGLMTLTPGWR